MKNIGFGMLVLGVLCMVGNAWGYDTYVGVTLTEVDPAGIHFNATNTSISIPAIGYSKALNQDADGKWSAGETTYTDLVTLTEGVEYTVDISALSISHEISFPQPNNAYTAHADLNSQVMPAIGDAYCKCKECSGLKCTDQANCGYWDHTSRDGAGLFTRCSAINSTCDCTNWAGCCDSVKALWCWVRSNFQITFIA